MSKKKKSRLSFYFFVPVILALALASAFVTIRRSYFESPQKGCCAIEYSGGFEQEKLTGIFEEQEVSVPGAVFANNFNSNTVLGVATPDGRWVEIDLSEQKLRAWDGTSLFLETLVSTGLPWWRTPTGEFRIWIKLRATKMEGGAGRYYYYLPNVPFVMYFGNAQIPNWRGYGLHGTYWHNDFGTPRSHGCVNLPTSIAERLYYWTSPAIQLGINTVYASADNPGTRIVIHD